MAAGLASAAARARRPARPAASISKLALIGSAERLAHVRNARLAGASTHGAGLDVTGEAAVAAAAVAAAAGEELLLQFARVDRASLFLSLSLSFSVSPAPIPVQWEGWQTGKKKKSRVQQFNRAGRAGRTDVLSLQGPGQLDDATRGDTDIQRASAGGDFSHVWTSSSDVEGLPSLGGA